ncbi:PREDICTED: sperm acrosome membrane-associated protein 4-like [Poecilia mexicana]|uniref:UPAR/Ly6 domain-containing protein n=1 Tax=Poecilia mexicana TaxID=48701 RepID=A0A3B3YLR9_9TELE|nr:PREDICTED: sperm acrosome membrane-associated protein 4-like [Poecilia mexicana]
MVSALPPFCFLNGSVVSCSDPNVRFPSAVSNSLYNLLLVYLQVNIFSPPFCLFPRTLDSSNLTGQNLECYKCSIGLWNLCLTSKITCGTGEHCFSGEGGSGDVKLKMKGCLEVAKCNKTDDVKLPGSSNTTIYKMTKTCCSTNLCNAAPGLPGASALSLAAVAMFSLLAANFMV